jgi:hypothetical protein
VGFLRPFGQVADPVTRHSPASCARQAIGFNTMRSPYQWFDANAIAAEVEQTKKNDPDASLGDNEALEIANLLNGKCDVDLLFGFQRSRYGRKFEVPANVVSCPTLKRRHCWCC